jgi:hypothetical protein
MLFSSPPQPIRLIFLDLVTLTFHKENIQSVSKRTLQPRKSIVIYTENIHNVLNCYNAANPCTFDARVTVLPNTVTATASAPSVEIWTRSPTVPHSTIRRRWPRRTHSLPARRRTPSLPWRSARVLQHPFPRSVDWSSMATSFPGSYTPRFFLMGIR